jgi:hypothetical protein
LEIENTGNGCGEGRGVRGNKEGTVDKGNDSIREQYMVITKNREGFVKNKK